MKPWDWVMAALCAAWLLALIWIAGPTQPVWSFLWTEEAAAWAQAIGATAALVALFVIQRRDHLHQREQAFSQVREAEAASLEHLGAVLQDAHTTIEGCIKISNDGGWSPFNVQWRREQLLSDIAALDAMDPSHLPRAGRLAWSLLRRCLRATVLCFDMIERKLPEQPTLTIFDLALSQINQCESEVVEALARYFEEGRSASVH